MAVEETGRAFVVRGLGPLTVYCQDVPLDLGGRRQRVLLAVLLAHLDRVVPTDRLIDGLWGRSRPRPPARRSRCTSPTSAGRSVTASR